jgi:nifR3 family TIM-barrel protein
MVLTREQAIFYIRSIPIHGNAILAPMDGYSDLPFRVLARELGSAASWTEFINARDVIYAKRPGFETRLAYLEEERPVVFQIYDDDPQRILRAALSLEERGPDILDVNMGCPAKTVSNRGAGAGLLKDPQKIANIFKLLTSHLKIPITGKIRLGWDEDTINYLEVAKIIEDNGGSMVAVHGRTRQQGYRGEANWDAIAEVKRAVKIPVIGNGDVRLFADIKKMMDSTGCDAVMIGRGAKLNPWIFSGLERSKVPQEMVYQSARRHLELSVQFYSAERGLILFRKFIKSYTSLYVLDAATKRALVTTTDLQAFEDLLADVFFRKLEHQIGLPAIVND